MKLFEPGLLGDLPIANRIVMSPMTRNRATEGGFASDLTASYYSQRAGAGLIITEGIQPSVIGQGYLGTCGLHSAEQAASWKPVTYAVHEKGSRIFAQLMHTGRVGHPTITADGLTPVAPSPVRAPGQIMTRIGMQDFVTPEELSIADIAETINDHVVAAEHAIEAGFDGIEIHAGYGYLAHQFFAPNSNQRADGYGGDVAGRIRFAVETASAIAQAIGGNRVGMRISPGNGNNGIEEADTAALYANLLAALNALGMAYIHIAEFGNRDLTVELRKVWSGSVILNAHPRSSDSQVTPEIAEEALTEGVADAVSFASLFLANPDLPTRILAGGPYNTPDPETFYGGDHRGYTDYPTLTSDD